MINRIPEYLKLFVDEEIDLVEEEFSIPQIDRFRRAFPLVTGFRLHVVERRADRQLAFPWSSPNQTAFKVELESTSQSKLNSLADTREFEEALASLFNLLGETQYQLQLREAELAASVPVVSVTEDQTHLSERLHHVLRGAADMTRCTAAGLYMLDEATTSLKLRSSFGMDADALLQPPRPLEDAIADVEALAGHAVVVTDADGRSRWRVPYPCNAAMCVPISTATTILGTLWMFRSLKADFTVEEQNLAEITAGRLASDLERAVLTQEVRTLRDAISTADFVSPIRESHTAWETETYYPSAERLPPIIEGWELANGQANLTAPGDFCDWFQTKSDTLHLAVGGSRSSNPNSSPLVFQSSHAAHTSHDPRLRELIQHTNQSLWQSSAEGEAAALFHAVLDPSCGRLEYVCLGGTQAFILRPHAWEPLTTSHDFLGVDHVCDAQIHRQVLMPGDILFATSLPAHSSPANSIAEKLLRNIHLTATELERLAASEISSMVSSDESIAILVAKRDELS